MAPVLVTSPQLEFYAAERAGRTAIIRTATGDIVAWVVRDGDLLRVRRYAWLSEPLVTIPQLIGLVSAHFAPGAETTRVDGS